VNRARHCVIRTPQIILLRRVADVEFNRHWSCPCRSDKDGSVEHECPLRNALVRPRSCCDSGNARIGDVEMEVVGKGRKWCVKEQRHIFVRSNVELTGRRRQGALAARRMMNQKRFAAKAPRRWRSGSAPG
jgi:hypothetical protein